MSPTGLRPIALITGASSGIGKALTHCFALAPHDLVLVALSADKLHALAAGTATICPHGAGQPTVIDLNISSLTAMFWRFLPLVIKRASGRVLAG